MIDSKQFNEIFYNGTKAKKTVDKIYRLYYNIVTSKPIEYSMEKLKGNYITITKDQYAEGRYDVIIVDGCIVKSSAVQYVRKLVQDNNGIACKKSNVLILDKTSSSKWKIKTTIIA